MEMFKDNTKAGRVIQCVFTFPKPVSILVNTRPIQLHMYLHTPLCSGTVRKQIPVILLFQLKILPGASLVNQWLRRVCAAIQGSGFQSLIWEDPTCGGVARPARVTTEHAPRSAQATRPLSPHAANKACSPIEHVVNQKSHAVRRLSATTRENPHKAT